MSSFVMVGVLARIDVRSRNAIERQLSAHPGVSVFPVDDPGRIGILIETTSLADAEARLRDPVLATPGVLGAWPVFVHDDSVGAEAATGRSNTPVVGREVAAR